MNFVIYAGKSLEDSANDSCCRKMFIGGLNWETTDREFALMCISRDDVLASWLTPVAIHKSLSRTTFHSMAKLQSALS